MESKETTGNHSDANRQTKVVIIVEHANGSATVSSYETDQDITKPLKVFDRGPITSISHEKLPKRFAEIWKQAFSKAIKHEGEK